MMCLGPKEILGSGVYWDDFRRGSEPPKVLTLLMCVRYQLPDALTPP